MDIEFDETTHTYRHAGRIVPGVTSVLEPLQLLEGVSRAVLEAAREFGTHVHLACHLFNQGTLDEASLDPALVPYLEGWKSFLAHTGFEVTASEERVFNRKLWYAGTADVFGKFRGTTWVLDIKSGAIPGTVGAQLAAYQHAALERPRRRLCVQLTGERGLGYKLHECTDLKDFALFQSALNLHRYLNRHLEQRERSARVNAYG